VIRAIRGSELEHIDCRCFATSYKQETQRCLNHVKAILRRLTDVHEQVLHEVLSWPEQI